MNLVSKALTLVPARWLRAAAALQWRSTFVRRLYRLTAASLRNRDGIIARGAGKGLRFNPGNANAGYLLGTSEPAVQESLRALLRGGWVFWDVGANVGFLSVIAAREVGTTGRVIAFEPLPLNAALIRRNAALNGFLTVEVREEALSDREGESAFLVSAQAEWGKLPVRDAAVEEQTGEIRVRLTSIDHLRRNDAAPRPDLIKMDIEGAEAVALRGGRETLLRERPLLMIELHGTNPEVAEILRDTRYHAVVVGSGGTVVEAPWNAYLVAVPEENAEMVRYAERFGSPDFGRR